MQFLYCGEAEILEENIESFLLLAQQLQLKGLTGVETEETKDKKVKPLDKTDMISEENVKYLKKRNITGDDLR